MKRKIYAQLLDWKQNMQGRTALLIEGARRIGKSYIVEEFAKNEYKSYIIIDFAHRKFRLPYSQGNLPQKVGCFFVPLHPNYAV